jgi:hypothetical protein
MWVLSMIRDAYLEWIKANPERVDETLWGLPALLKPSR